MAEFDAELVRALRAGEAAPFAEVVQVFLPRIRSMAMRYFHSPFDQEEAIQEVFLQLYRQREAIDPLRAESLWPFAATLARRRMIDLLRARSREVELPEPDEAEAKDGPSPEQEVASAQLQELLARFEERLKPAHRSFFRAVFVEGKDFDEARDSLGLGRLRAKYLKKVLLGRLRRHRPLLEHLGRSAR
ncbi:MAG: sigma-70 family RNA polymerase sigma factor [Myxococcales bacterium]|nr:sigma-70 family RNA polymerase sigma factor [Myxococcales bacterium]